MRVWIAIGIVCVKVSLGQVCASEKLSCCCKPPPTTPQFEAELAAIDAVVLQLIDLRNKELAYAAWAQNQGDRLQFQPQNLLDARRYWLEAEESRETAARYQSEIDQLEDRKNQLLKKEGIDVSSTS